MKWYGALTDIEDRKSAEALHAGERRLFEMIATGVSLKEIFNELCLIIQQQRPGTLVIASDIATDPQSEMRGRAWIQWN